MAYSSYSSSLYAPQMGFNAVQMGSASTGNCPQGAISSGICKANNIPQFDYLSGEIPVTNPLSPGAKTNPPYPSLTATMNQAYKDTQAQGAVDAFEMQCCPNPGPCQEQVYWRAAFKGCPYSFSDDPATRCEVNPVGDRIMVADLNPLIYERSIMQQAEPDGYKFMNARQMWIQFLMKDMVQTRDPYSRPISDLDQSFCMQQNLHGPPAYTNF